MANFSMTHTIRIWSYCTASVKVAATHLGQSAKRRNKHSDENSTSQHKTREGEA